MEFQEGKAPIKLMAFYSLSLSADDKFLVLEVHLSDLEQSSGSHEEAREVSTKA